MHFRKYVVTFVNDNGETLVFGNTRFFTAAGAKRKAIFYYGRAWSKTTGSGWRIFRLAK